MNCRTSTVYLWKSMKIESQQQLWEGSVKHLFAGTLAHDRDSACWFSKTHFWRQRKTPRKKVAGGLLRWNLATGWSNCRSRLSRRLELEALQIQIRFNFKPKEALVRSNWNRLIRSEMMGKRIHTNNLQYTTWMNNIHKLMQNRRNVSLLQKDEPENWKRLYNPQ